MTRADAVVVAYRSAATIGRCIETLRADPAVDRIIVVNNDPDDARTAAIVRGCDGVDLVEPDGNVGFGKGVNLARPLVRQPYVAIVNPDTTQTGDTISACIRRLGSEPRAAAVGPRILDRHGRLFHSSEHDISLPRLVLARLEAPFGAGVQRSTARHRRPHRTDALNGAFFVARVAALDAVGWFDPSIFLYGEEYDLFRRMRAAGWTIWYDPVGCVVHLGGESTSHLPDAGESLLREARHEQLRRWRGERTAAIYKRLVKSVAPTPDLRARNERPVGRQQ